ncbi:gephyrin-like molybdotransferase receptor GlpR [Streptomyces sp. NPDC004647]|uniref:divisome protein SepX/GlpR n=1 Tax=Streptomyces sp. NPDC004647 TaxID=3154671 RepID=UPI0033B2013F
MSSSGLIYAVIVGAWAAYLVPMWLRRQDELNEARPTERFSTAIRLLSGRAAMERRYAKGLEERNSDDGDAFGDEGGRDDSGNSGASSGPERGATDPDAVTDAVDVRAFAVPEPRTETRSELRSEPRTEVRDERPAPRSAARPTPSAAERARRSKVLARRRRTTMALFLAFTLGSVVAAVGGLAFLWAPAGPAVLLSAYIAHLRAQERRRFTFTMDQRRAEAAAQRLREHRPRASRRPDTGAGDEPADAVPGDPAPSPATAASPAPASPHTADRRALVEQTDHAEWVDQQRERGGAAGASWDPVPVPLPTYVTAPVAPRATGSVDLDAPDAWSSARSSTAGATAEAASAEPEPDPAPATRRPPGRRARGRTPLFDQYADEDRPRAANE